MRRYKDVQQLIWQPLSGGYRLYRRHAFYPEAGLVGKKVLAALRAHFDIAEDAEITIESNPRTLTEEKLTAYRQAGVNRLSMGLQSFDENCLKTLGRVHTAQDFVSNYQMARACGFDNINVDLMFAVPGHTMDIWQDTLERTIALAPEHISFYSLQIEEGTPFTICSWQGV